jgi:hypothetical protein
MPRRKPRRSMSILPMPMPMPCVCRCRCVCAAWVRGLRGAREHVCVRCVESGWTGGMGSERWMVFVPLACCAVLCCAVNSASALCKTCIGQGRGSLGSKAGSWDGLGKLLKRSASILGTLAVLTLILFRSFCHTPGPGRLCDPLVLECTHRQPNVDS